MLLLFSQQWDLQNLKNGFDSFKIASSTQDKVRERIERPTTSALGQCSTGHVELYVGTLRCMMALVGT